MTLGKGRLWALVAAAVSLAVALGFATPTQASAAEGGTVLAAGSAQVTTQEDVTMVNPDWVTLWAGDQERSTVSRFLMYTDSDLEVTNVQSSNSAVLKVSKLDSQKKTWSYEVSPLKVGKAKLSVTLTQNGASKTISETYVVKAYPNPITSITFNGESLTVPTAKAPFSTGYYFGFKGTSATLNMKVASGWEITYMSVYTHNQGASGKSVDITNGKAFDIPKGSQGSVNVNLYNSASSENVSYYLNVYRDMPLTLVAKPTYYIGYPKVSGLQIKSLYGNFDDIKVVSVKSSNSSVITVKKNKLFSKVKVQAKKAGKSKITVKYTYKGKTYTATAQCTASKDYPVKSVSVNGKSLNLKKNCGGYWPKAYKKNTAKIKITAAKGWKVKSIRSYAGYSDPKGKKVKNGASIKTPKGQATSVVATLKKGKTTYTYHWYFDRS